MRDGTDGDVSRARCIQGCVIGDIYSGLQEVGTLALKTAVIPQFIAHMVRHSLCENRLNYIAQLVIGIVGKRLMRKLHK